MRFEALEQCTRAQQADVAAAGLLEVEAGMEVGDLHRGVVPRRAQAPDTLAATRHVKLDEGQVGGAYRSAVMLAFEQRLVEVGVAMVEAPREVRRTAYARRGL